MKKINVFNDINSQNAIRKSNQVPKKKEIAVNNNQKDKDIVKYDQKESKKTDKKTTEEKESMG